MTTGRTRANGATGGEGGSLSPGAVPPGWRLISLGSVDSTQARARASLESGAGRPLWPGHALVVVADEQTGGRGRHGRAWVSPPGNLYVTIAVPCPDGPRRGVELGFVGGVAVAEALGDLGFDGRDVPGGGMLKKPAARLKWPNDVLLDGAKVAGLLPESATDAEGGGWVLLGLGVNVTMVPATADMRYPVTALVRHGGQPAPSPGDVLGMILARLATWLVRWRTPAEAGGGFAAVRAAWLRHGHGIGDPVRVRGADGLVTGVFEGLAENGAMRLRPCEGGPIRTILAGDVFFPVGSEG